MIPGPVREDTKYPINWDQSWYYLTPNRTQTRSKVIYKDHTCHILIILSSLHQANPVKDGEEIRGLSFIFPSLSEASFSIPINSPHRVLQWLCSCNHFARSTETSQKAKKLVVNCCCDPNKVLNELNNFKIPICAMPCLMQKLDTGSWWEHFFAKREKDSSHDFWTATFSPWRCCWLCWPSWPVSLPEGEMIRQANILLFEACPASYHLFQGPAEILMMPWTPSWCELCCSFLLRYNLGNLLDNYDKNEPPAGKLTWRWQNWWESNICFAFPQNSVGFQNVSSVLVRFLWGFVIVWHFSWRVFLSDQESQISGLDSTWTSFR